MKHFAWCSTLLTFIVFGLLSMHATARAAGQSCSMNQSSLADLIANYDPPLSTTSSTITVNSGTLTFTCTGLGSGPASHVYVLVSGASGAYTRPFLTGPSSFQLTYSLCVPNAATCNASTNLWNTTVSTSTAYEVSANNSPAVNSIPSFLIFVGRQDAPVGAISQYSGSLFFSFRCGEGGSQVAC
jgi:hypothetical protein